MDRRPGAGAAREPRTLEELESKFFKDGERGLVMLEPEFAIPRLTASRVILSLGALIVVISGLMAVL